MKGMNSVRNTKKILALVLSVVLCLSLLTLTAGAKDLGVDAAAILDTDKLSVSDTAQTVALTIAMRSDITTDGIGGELYCPDGWTLTSISSTLPGFNASCYNLNEKGIRLAYGRCREYDRKGNSDCRFHHPGKYGGEYLYARRKKS